MDSLPPHALEVQINAVQSPSLFWATEAVSPKMSENRQHLQLLEEKMGKLFWNSRETLVFAPIREEGDLVAVKNHGSRLIGHRGKITRILHTISGTIYEVFLVDHGSTVRAKPDHLRTLSRITASELAPQAMLLELYGIVPVSVMPDYVNDSMTVKIEENWTAAASHYVNDIWSKSITAYFVGSNRSPGRVYGDLYLTLKGTQSVFSLIEKLCGNGYAIQAEDEFLKRQHAAEEAKHRTDRPTLSTTSLDLELVCADFPNHTAGTKEKHSKTSIADFISARGFKRAQEAFTEKSKAAQSNNQSNTTIGPSPISPLGRFQFIVRAKEISSTNDDCISSVQSEENEQKAVCLNQSIVDKQKHHLGRFKFLAQAKEISTKKSCNDSISSVQSEENEEKADKADGDRKGGSNKPTINKQTEFFPHYRGDIGCKTIKTALLPAGRIDNLQKTPFKFKSEKKAVDAFRKVQEERESVDQCSVQIPVDAPKDQTPLKSTSSSLKVLNQPRTTEGNSLSKVNDVHIKNSEPLNRLLEVTTSQDCSVQQLKPPANHFAFLLKCLHSNKSVASSLTPEESSLSKADDVPVEKCEPFNELFKVTTSQDCSVQNEQQEETPTNPLVFLLRSLRANQSVASASSAEQ